MPLLLAAASGHKLGGGEVLEAGGLVLTALNHLLGHDPLCVHLLVGFDELWREGEGMGGVIMCHTLPNLGDHTHFVIVDVLYSMTAP